MVFQVFFISLCKIQVFNYDCPPFTYERHVDRVIREVMDGFVSLEKAKEDYGVVIDPESMKVDEEATEILRNSVATEEQRKGESG